jgi:hypothetical protein
MLDSGDDSIPLTYRTATIANIKRKSRGTYEVPGVGKVRLKAAPHNPQVVPLGSHSIIVLLMHVVSQTTDRIAPAYQHVWSLARRWEAPGSGREMNFPTEDEADSYFRTHRELMEQCP